MPAFFRWDFIKHGKPLPPAGFASAVPFGTFSNDEHALKAGVNYRFNFGGSAAARY